nr:hypothetical protein [Tanacetum cinerariifolium]
QKYVYLDTYQSPKPSISSRSHTSTRHKGKEIAKPITPPSETASEEDSDPEQAQRDKDMQNNLAFIAKYFKNIYKPTTTTSEHPQTPRTRVWIRLHNTRMTIILDSLGIRGRKPKRVKDSAYHKEKMLLYKQAEQGVPLQAEQYDWLVDTDEEVDEQELEAHYSYMAKIQEVPNADSGIDSEPVEQVLNKVEYNVFSNALQHSEQSKSVSNTCLVETDDSNVTLDSPDIQSLRESISVQDSCLVALQTKQTEFKKYKAFNDRTVDYDKLERKLNDALGQIAHKDTVINQGLKTKACELSVVKEKHDELMKQSILTKSHYEGLVKQKMKVITNLKLKEEHDIEKMLSMEKQIKFLNEVVCKRSQSIHTIHMMAPKVSTYNGRPIYANPRYLKQAQSKIPCLYAYPYNQNTHANRLIPDGEETLALERESRSKLNKDSVRPYDYTKLNSLYEIFKPPTQEYETQLAHANEIRRKMCKSQQAYNVMTNNINHFKQICDDAWTKHSKDLFHAPTALDMELLIQTCLMPLAIKTQGDSLKFVHELKQEVHSDLKYVESLEKEIDALESEKAEFSDMYDVKECDCLAQKLSKQTESVSKKFVNEKALNVFRKEREQYFEIQDLKAQMQDKNITIGELKKLIEKGKGKFVDTKFDKPSVVRQPNALRIPKPSVLGKPTPSSDPLKRRYFSKTRSAPKTNVSEGLSKPVTTQTLPQTAKKVVSNTNVLRPGMYRIDNRTAHTRAPQLTQTVRNTNLRMSTSTGVNHKPNVSRPQLKSNQSRDKVLPNNSQSFWELFVLEMISLRQFLVMEIWFKEMSRSTGFTTSKASITISSQLVNFVMRIWRLLSGSLHVLLEIFRMKYILVIIDDYLRYTWTLFLRSKDETPEVLNDFLMMIQRNLQAPVITVHTTRGTEFLNKTLNAFFKTLNAFFKEEGIKHQTSTARIPEQNGVVERWNITPRVLGSLTMSISSLNIFSVIRVCL